MYFSQLVRHWILKSCHPQTVISGRSISVISSLKIQNSSHIQTFSQASLQNKPLHKHETQHTQICEDLVPLILPLLKEHIKPGSPLDDPGSFCHKLFKNSKLFSFKKKLFSSQSTKPTLTQT